MSAFPAFHGQWLKAFQPLISVPGYRGVPALGFHEIPNFLEPSVLRLPIPVYL